MLLRFTGTYTGGRTSITLCGVTFTGREPAEVSGEEALRRLSTHPEFEGVTAFVAPPEIPHETPKPRGRPKKAG